MVLKMSSASVQVTSQLPRFVMGMYSKSSHQLVHHPCESRSSEKCYGILERHYRDLRITYENNDGKIICLPCSRRTKASGRNNPNCRYKDLDDNFFRVIDTVHKAYLLGWIASDGHIQHSGFRIGILATDRACLEQLRDIICLDIPIALEASMVILTVNSMQISKDLTRHLKLEFKEGESHKKDSIVQFPDLDSDELRWAFMRGLFDGDGCIGSRNNEYPRASLSSNSSVMRRSVIDISGVQCRESLSESRSELEWSGSNAVTFLKKLYAGDFPYLQRKYDLFRKYKDYFPHCRGHYTLFSYLRTSPLAKAPCQNRTSDAGYLLHLVQKIREENGIHYYDTLLKLDPLPGVFLELTARECISITGYKLVNKMTIIDKSHQGSIIITLTKIDPNAPELKLPAKIIKIYPKQIPVVPPT